VIINFFNLNNEEDKEEFNKKSFLDFLLENKETFNQMFNDQDFIKYFKEHFFFNEKLLPKKGENIMSKEFLEIFKDILS
jgi:hypothetical protein